MDSEAQPSAQSFNRHFPQEIIDEIIDFLHDDLETLESLSIVSKSMCNRSQYHILFSVELFPPNWRKTCRRFYKLLQESPHIARFVKKLYLTDAHRDKYSWVLHSYSLPLVLDKLVNLRYLSFEFPSDYPDYKSEPTWSAASPALYMSLYRLAEPHRALHTLKVSFVNVYSCIIELARFVGSCSTLKRLSLYQIWAPLDDDWMELLLYSTSIPWSPQLEYLSITESKCDVLFNFLTKCSPNNATRLRQLTCRDVIFSDENGESLMREFWSFQADTLEDLTIAHSYMEVTAPGPLITVDCMTRLCSLKRLTLRALPFLVHTYRPEKVRYLYDHDISAIYDSCSLEEFTLIFEMERDPLEWLQDWAGPGPWRELDEILTRSLPAHSRLSSRRVIFSYKSSRHGLKVKDLKLTKAWLEKSRCPTLHANGCLTFKYFES